MQFLVRAVVAAAVLAASAAADASTFNFSYTFADGQQLAGSLDGTLNGTHITDISNLRVSLNGIDFAGGLDGAGSPTALAIYGYDPTSFAFGTVAPVFSTVFSENNFGIFDMDPALGTANYQFAFTNDPVTGALVVASNFLASDRFNPEAFQLAIDPTSGGALGTWSVTEAPVPLPAALPLLLSGLGLFGLARGRRAA